VSLVVILASTAFSSPVLAVVPEVRNVVPYDVGGSTYLNITVYHTPEIADHYVNMINVTMGSNTTTLTLSVQTLTPQDTFTVSYDLGPTQGTPSITVKAYCVLHGWSAVNWSGTVSEYSLPVLLMALALVSASAVFLHRKNKRP
jgi:desulfoferrodoxin (superoxide reductase-like protein)